MCCVMDMNNATYTYLFLIMILGLKLIHRNIFLFSYVLTVPV